MMKPKEIFCGKQPPTKKCYRNRLHTAVLKGIAVFFYSTPIYLFFFQDILFNNFPTLEAFVARRALFLFVGKCQMPQYFIYFWRGQAVLRKTAAIYLETYTYAVDELSPVLISLLFEWQAFICRYP